MGSLGGHLVPGSFFIIFSLWWSFVTTLRYFKSKLKTPSNNKNYSYRYKSTTTMPCICLPCVRLRRAPTESIIKLAFALIGFLIELIAAFDFKEVNIYQIVNSSINIVNPVSPTESMQHEHGHEHGGGHAHEHHKRSSDMNNQMTQMTWTFAKGNLQHMTMYSGFALGSVVEIMLHYNADIPKKLDFAFGFLAFLVEGFLFAAHLHGKAALEIYLHVLLVYAVFACAIFSLLEIYRPHQIIFTYGRILCVILQGTWFYQVGFMLYPPTSNPSFHWDLEDHSLIMVTSAIFCWHIFLIAFGLLLQHYFIKRFVYRKGTVYNRLLEELIIADGERDAINSIDDFSSETKYKRLNLNEESEADSADENVLFNMRNKPNKTSNV
jgi:hypothetical protein